MQRRPRLPVSKPASIERGSLGRPAAPLTCASDMIKSPSLGFGLGLRVEHYEAMLAAHPPVDGFEALTENYLVPGGKPLHNLMRIRERYPLVMHGVSMSIGSTAPLDRGYLAQVKALAARVEPQWISDHLCWTGVAGKNLHDLMP